MQKQTKKIPKLRFPEFSGEWEKGKLGDVFERITRKNTENNQNVLTISAQQGLMNQEKYFNKSVSASDVTRYYLLNRGEFTYNKSYSKGYPIGAIKKLNRYKKGVVSTLYICFKLKNKEHSGDFFEQYFDSGFVNREIGKITQEGARAHGLLNMNIRDFFENVSLSVPKAEEQQKIASFLFTVDEWIENLRNQKVELEKYKKGMVQKIFSQKIRFKDDNGKDFPEWKEERLKSFCDFFSGGTPTSTNSKFYSGDIPFIGSGEINFSNVNKHITKEALENSSAKLINKGDLLFALYGATSGEVSISKLDGAINQAILCIKTENNKEFLYQWLCFNKGKILSKYLQGGQGNLSSNIVKNLLILLPPIEEQEKIANFLTSLDNMIESKQAEISQAEMWKKGLMQRMFI